MAHFNGNKMIMIVCYDNFINYATNSILFEKRSISTGFELFVFTFHSNFFLELPSK